jgi:hypothetical protein
LRNRTTDCAVTVMSIRFESWSVVVQPDALSPTTATVERMSSRRLVLGFALSMRTEEGCSVLPNVRAKLPAEASAVSLVRDDAPSAADQAYSACRSGSA